MKHENIPLLTPNLEEEEDGFQFEEYSSGSEGLPTNLVGGFRGVFLPCICSIIGFILFTRFGYVVGEAGVFNSLVLTILASLSICMTVLSTSAILSNGNFQSKNIYYIVSRTLGSEFGGALGISFYLANVFGLAFYVVGLTETLTLVLGTGHHPKSPFPKLIPVTYAYSYLYSTIILAITCIFTILGSKYYDKSLIFIFFMQSATILIIVVSFFLPINKPQEYTGFSLHTLKQNMFSDYTNDSSNNIVTFQTIFSIIYPAVTGTQAVESINDNVYKPHINIPKGALSSTVFICAIYTIFTLLIGSTLKRSLLVTNYYYLLDISIFPLFVFVGMISSTFSSIISTMLGASMMLLNNPVCKLTPLSSILITWFLCQILLLTNIDLNSLSTFVSMFYLLADLCINASCLLLQVSSTPNFRPLFQYYNKVTASIGIVFSIGSMIYIHPFFSGITLSSFGLLILMLKKKHGVVAGNHNNENQDVGDAILYHQIRKYLLRLGDMNVEHWRPQILLIMRHLNTHLSTRLTPKTVFNKSSFSGSSASNLLQFTNDLKKSGLFILSTLISDVNDYNKSYLEHAQMMEELQIKAFVDVIVGDNYEDGILQLTCSAGLGGLRPNIIMLEYPKVEERKADLELTGLFSQPKTQEATFVHSGKFTGALHAILAINKHIILARDFELLKISSSTRYIDIWPLKIYHKKENLDSYYYTFALQMGCILQKSHEWKDNSIIRVFRLVMHKSEIQREKVNFNKVLEHLRIKATIQVIHIRGYLDNEDTGEMPSPISQSSTTTQSREIFMKMTTRKQYMLINKLVKMNNRDATVILMTLPIPPEKDDGGFMRDLDILTESIEKPLLLLRGATTVISD